MTEPAKHLWILELTFDAIASSVRIVLTADPEQRTCDHELIVAQIISFHVERYHDADAVCLGDYGGLQVSRVKDHWRYKLDTGDATVTFDSAQKVAL
jgi:hypothetical protein